MNPASQKPFYMRFRLWLSMLLSIITITIFAQNQGTPALDLGDPAPPLRVRAWLKGEPVEAFEKGKVYVVEFWATWCRPCIQAMPYLSALARQYEDQLTILSIDVFEKKITTLENVRDFVLRMGSRMDYLVAADDSNFTATAWLTASGYEGIPRSFVVNAEGKIAWIGHPGDLDEVLPAIVNNKWDVKKARAEQEGKNSLAALDRKITDQVFKYMGDPRKGDFGSPDSVLWVINEIVAKEPRLKYAPLVASHAFPALLRTNPQKALEFGKGVIRTPTYEDPAWHAIIDGINWLWDELTLSPEIYQLGAEAWEAKIDRTLSLNPDHDFSGIYLKVADWYFRGKNKSKAVEAQEKAIEAVKKKAAMEIAELEIQLHQYENM